jgi:peptidoglycan/LPS O-acetylase OafA/YrhL
MPGGFVGVDVFFVISGFLITGLLLKEAEQTGTISLSAFYARRAKRILPAATLVLLASALLTYLCLPRTRWDDTATHILAAAFNVVNWVLAGSAVDYLAGDDAASPVQHFWTLAVEEQFYIVWPLLIVGAMFLSTLGRPSYFRGLDRGFNPRARLNLIRLAVVLLTVPSLIWSTYYTVAEPGAAYFVTTTRAWELGIGACVAVFATSLRRIPETAKGLLSWGGLAAITASSLFYSAETPFPGTAALLPTLGAAAIIVGGMSGRDRFAAGRLLSTSQFVWVGNISYSLYLWHWPLIVIATYVLGGLQFYQGLIVVGLSLIPAYLSYRYVEKPILAAESLKDNYGASLATGLSLILVAGIAAMSILLVPKPISTAGFVPMKPLADTGSEPVAAVIGAALLAQNPMVGQVTDTVMAFQPAALAAAKDNPVVYDQGCHQTANGTEAKSCVFGSEEGEFKIAIVGDSHAAQWVPALTEVADKHGWRMESFTKSACAFTRATLTFEGGAYDTCTQWNQAVTEALTGEQRPDFVLFTSSDYEARTPGPSSSEGLAQAWSALRAANVPFAVLADTPRPGINVPECVSANPDSLSKCAVDRLKAEQNGTPDLMYAAEAVGGVPVIDLNRMICPESRCAPIIGDVLVYRDTNHLTATYAESLAGALEAELIKLRLPTATGDK